MDCPPESIRIRWRYTGSDWQEIIGADDYSLEQDWYGGQNPNIQYRYKYGRANLTWYGLINWTIFYQDQPADIVMPISNMRMTQNNIDYGIFYHWKARFADSGNAPPEAATKAYRMEVFDATGQWKVWGFYVSSSHKVYGLEPADGSIEESPRGGDCVFTITKNGRTVYRKKHENCPEVEKYCNDEKCPDQTCRCEHGSVVCCHDSKTGEVIKQFRR